MVTGRRAGLATLLVTALLVGCEREPTRIELPEQTVLVHAMLEVGADSVLVHLARAAPGPDGTGAIRIDPVAGVSGEIRGAAGAGSLHPAPAPARCMGYPAGMPVIDDTALPQPGCYLARLPGAMEEGERYELLAELPGGARVRGVVELPERPEILAPAPETTLPAGWRSDDPNDPVLVSRERTDIAWRTGSGTAWTYLRGAVTAVTLEGSRIPPGACRIAGGSGRSQATPGQDSTQWRINAFHCASPSQGAAATAARPDSVHLDLLVTAHDSAYVRARAARETESVRYRDVAVGLEGAVGVFSGAATARLPLVLVADGGVRPLRSDDDDPH